MSDTAKAAALGHRVEVSPGFYLVRPEPSKNYGIGACRVTFYAIGALGAVQFMIGTDWYPERARQHLSKFPSRPVWEDTQPTGWDVGYHAKVPQYEGHTSSGQCEVIGCECFYDGSSRQADEWIEGFINGGTDWLWPRLDQLYRCRFEGGEYPDVTPIPKLHPDEIAGAVKTTGTPSTLTDLERAGAGGMK